MKKTNLYTALIFALCAFFLIISGCNIEEIQLPKKNGYLTLSVNNADLPRTILPKNITYEKYIVKIFNGSTKTQVGTDHVWTSGKNSDTIALTTGLSYEVSVDAYVKAADTTPAASGKNTIAKLSEAGAKVNIVLQPAAAGKGIFSWNITLHESITGMSIQIANQSPIVIKGTGAVTSKSIELDKGVYDVKFILQYADGTITLPDNLYIYANLTSHFEYNFSSRSLYTLTNYITNAISTGQLAGLQIEAFTDPEIGIIFGAANFNEVKNEFTALITAGGAPGNLTELKALVDASLIKLGIAVTYSSQTEAQTAVSGLIKNGTVPQYEFNNSVLTVKTGSFRVTTVIYLEVEITHNSADVSGKTISIYIPDGSVQLQAALKPANSNSAGIVYLWTVTGDAVTLNNTNSALVTVNSAGAGESNVTITIKRNDEIIDTASVTINVLQRPSVFKSENNDLFTAREGAASFSYHDKNWFVMAETANNFSAQGDSYFTAGNAAVFKTIPATTGHSRISRQLDPGISQYDWVTITYDLVQVSADNAGRQNVIRSNSGAAGGGDISNAAGAVYNNETGITQASFQFAAGINQTLSVRIDRFTSGGYFALAKQNPGAHLLRITKIEYSSGLPKPEPEGVRITRGVNDVSNTTISLYNPGGSAELTAALIPSNANDIGITYSWTMTGSAVSLSGNTGTPSITVNTEDAGTSTVTITVKKDAAVIDTATVTFNVTQPVVPTANATITVNTGTKYQYVRGFGGMDSSMPTSAYLLTMDEIELMFNPEKLGYNIMRIVLEANNTNPETTINGLRPAYVEGVKLVNSYGGYVLATPWSPPAIWKNNNSTNCEFPGTTDCADKVRHVKLLPENYQNYANYLKAFCDAMSSRGAPIYAVSMQNEPNDHVGYIGCIWSPEEVRDFFKLGNFTAGTTGWGGGKAQPKVLAMVGETMHDPDINIVPLNDTTARNNIDILGRHIYGWRQQRNIEQYGKEMWMTEYNINTDKDGTAYLDSTWNYVWQFMNSIDLTMRLNNENAYIWWTSKRFYSLIGDGTNTTTAKEVLPRGHGLSHYAKFAKETNRVAVSVTGNTGSGSSVTTTGTSANFNHGTFSEVDGNAYENAVKVTAYESSDGSISLVMYTPTFRSGSGGVNMGTVRINMPSGFTIGTATAVRSTATVKSQTENVILGADKTHAFVTLPASNILSVKFTRQ